MIAFNSTMAAFQFVDDGSNDSITTIFVSDELDTHPLNDLAGETFESQLVITYGDEPNDDEDGGDEPEFSMDNIERVIVERTAGYRGEGCYWMYAKKDGVWYFLDIVSQGTADKLTATDEQIEAALASTIEVAKNLEDDE